MNFILLLGIYVIIFTREVNCTAENKYSFHHTKKTIAGANASKGMFPYQAAILNLKNIFWGGALIAPRWVLTSAWCIEHGPVWQIKLGDLYHSSAEKETYKYSLRTHIGIKHYDWTNNDNYENDIGLLQLPSAVELNEFVNTVSLPKRCSIHDPLWSVRIRVSGWGRKERPVRDHLTYEDHITLQIKKCELEFNPGGAMFCSKPEINWTSTYSADYGGPAVRRDPISKEVTHEGVVISLKKKGFKEGNLVKYARTAYYLDWIHKVTNLPIRP